MLARSCCLLWLYSSLALATTGEPQPKIEPGYKPSDAATEKGLWMELEDYESSLRQSALLIKDGPVNDYVKQAACRVAGDYCNDFRVYIVRNPSFNASMTANGVMQVWTGLLVRVSSEDELAAVLGHELAHYTQLHTLERLRRIKSSLATSSVIDLLLGLPIARMATVANLMAFNRDQEEEADLLGVSFMAQSGYDPHAAASVWQMIVEEEESAASKREAPGLFSNTHPAAEDRIVTLTSYVEKNYLETKASEIDHRTHLEILNHYYLFLMEDQIDTNRFGRTEYMLKRHQQIGVNPSLIDFFYGEMYRQRKSEGDFELARQSYERAVQAEDPFVDAYRNLGYVHLKLKNPAQASVHFRKYLELKPDADDRAMIEFYLEE